MTSPLVLTGQHHAQRPLTVEHAHQTMQDHLPCATATCPARRTALSVLVATGRYKLAATR